MLQSKYRYSLADLAEQFGNNPKSFHVWLSRNRKRLPKSKPPYAMQSGRKLYYSEAYLKKIKEIRKDVQPRSSRKHAENKRSNFRKDRTLTMSFDVPVWCDMGYLEQAVHSFVADFLKD